ncbi:MAG: 4Fe-4S binding protein [Candidatus Thermoplasmatota archaeon]
MNRVKTYEQTGILALSDLILPSKKQLEKGVAILECIQEIPCNPCVDACPVHAISMKDINAPPVNNYDLCTGCTRCVGICPGLAIFVIKIKQGKAYVTLPYEFLPIPKVGDTVRGLDRAGVYQTDAVVTRVVRQGKTMVITIEVPEQYALEIRNIQV